MESGSGGTSLWMDGAGRVVRRVTSGNRVLVLDVPVEHVCEVDALLDDTASAVHTTLEQIPATQERFAVGVAHLGGSVHSLRPVVDALRLALEPDGVAIVVWKLPAVSGDEVIAVADVIQASFAVSYVVAGRMLWISQAAPLLPELSDVEEGMFMAIASDATWRLLAATETITPPEELKPIFRLVMEQAIHLDNQRDLLADFEHRLGVQSQQLAELSAIRASLRAAEDANAALASANAALASANAALETANAELTAEVELQGEQYAAVVNSAAWRLAERLRQLVRPHRQSAQR